MDIDKLDKKYSLTIGKYITNPTDNKGNLFLNLAMVKDGLSARYDKLKNNSNFKLDVYNNKGNVLVHVFVPSEKYDVTYDVLLQLKDYKEDGKPYNEKLIKNTNFEVFSNSPAFAFTYAFVFNKRKLLIPECINKYDKDILGRQPYQRNYYNIVNIEKSIYYAIRFLLDNYSTLGELESASKNTGFNYWGTIASYRAKIDEYNRVKKELKEQEAKDEKAKTRKQAVKRVITGNMKTGDTGRIITGKEHTKPKITSSKNSVSHRVKGKSKIK